MPSDIEIRAELDLAEDQNMEGNSQWPGMTYEQGVAATLRWISGDSDERPMEG